MLQNDGHDTLSTFMLKNNNLFFILLYLASLIKTVNKREGATDGEEEVKGRNECVGIVKRLILTLRERAAVIVS